MRVTASVPLAGCLALSTGLTGLATMLIAADSGISLLRHLDKVVHNLVLLWVVRLHELGSSLCCLIRGEKPRLQGQVTPPFVCLTEAVQGQRGQESLARAR